MKRSAPTHSYRLILVGTSVVLATALHGQNTPPTGEAAASAGGSAAPPAAAADANPATLRDPFWPIGWSPPNFGREEAREKLDGQVQWDSARQLLKITGLSRTTDGNYVAIIQGGGVVERGDVISVEYESLIYTWRIAKITREGIFPEQMDVTRKHN